MDKKVVHVSVDIETLGIDARAVVLSVGLAAFTLHGGVVGQHYCVLGQQEQGALGRCRDPGALKWWSEQSESARDVLAASEKEVVALSLRLGHIRNFIGRFSNEVYELGGVWGYGSDFDNATLISLASDAGAGALWPYKKNRCGRTVIALTGAAKPANVGVRHNALDDAKFQAEWIRQALLVLGRQGVTA